MTEEEFFGRPVEKKNTNPKDAVGVRKVSMSAVPSQPLMELGLAMMEGARKYGRHNYRVAGIRASVYYDAALRHLMAWWEGEDIDPDSGISHLSKAMACLVVVRDGMLRGNWVDDRPPSMADGWQSGLNKKAGDLIDRLPSSKEAYVKDSKTTDSTKTPEVDDYSWVKFYPGHGLLTTYQPPLPFPDNPVPPPSNGLCIDPKQSEWSPLLERQVPADSADKSRGGSRK